MFKWLENFFDIGGKNLRLGIDLGSSAIKIVEISHHREKPKLETYGMAYFSSTREEGNGFSHKFYIEEQSGSKKNISEKEPASTSALAVLSSNEISRILKELLLQAKAKTRKVYFSLPAFTTFFTVIELPLMSENEIAAAVPYEARKYIPLPLEEVVIDWSLITEEQVDLTQKISSEVDKIDKSNVKNDREADEETKSVKILVVAILKEAIEKYSQIAQLSGLEIKALEPENFSLLRALIGGGKDLIILVDIGSSFADITLIDKGFIRLVRSAKKVINPETKQLNKEVLITNIEKILDLYRSKQREKELSVPKCILTGGGALSNSLSDIIKEKLNIETIIGDPFQQIDYPPVLDSILKELGPSLSVAVGLAMKK